MSSGSNWDIPLLTTSNYSDWRDNIEALLKKDGLWGRLSASTPPASDAKAHREHVVAVEKAPGSSYTLTTLRSLEFTLCSEALHTLHSPPPF